MNLNELAESITEQEGKKVSVSIAQVKEILRLILKYIKSLSVEELSALLKRVK